MAYDPNSPEEVKFFTRKCKFIGGPFNDEWLFVDIRNEYHEIKGARYKRRPWLENGRIKSAEFHFVK